MLTILVNRITKNIWVQFIIMGPIELLKKLKKRVWHSSTTSIQETESDLKVTPRFKTTLPPNWEQRQQLKGKEKTEYFNNWASKL